MTEAQPTDTPLLRVVSGAPDEAELAALTAVVAALAVAQADAEEPAEADRTVWGDPASRLRAHGHRVPGGWRISGLPK